MKKMNKKRGNFRYNISRATVWRWADQGKIPKPFKLGSGSSRWSIVDLEQWESSKSSKEDK